MFVKNEWINQGNLEDKFTSSEVKRLIILDNASYHKKKDILEKIEQEMPKGASQFFAKKAKISQDK
ncbi:hypothetical protein [aff. Roholtiella sp. LEGE 12411]|uniref:hypothetical protein n=1 Tax=aff. Roholtiella sp. LEGE 12411 TaxID=1828822 RepID=UPI00187F8415|nr:hypothetical protein [aff. Roholtiella sp. LEGE 12411]MBE9039087.1 hypothetical protein [aff. Roholtiella sp. LEGE 12411]